MKKPDIKIQTSVLSIIIAFAIITLGYFGYKSLSQIVNSIHQAAIPDNKLLVIKSIAADLSEIENNVRIYILTNEGQTAELYNSNRNKVSESLNKLINQPIMENDKSIITDSLIATLYEKLNIWESIFQLHESAKESQPSLSEIYTKLGKPIIDTLKTERKKGIFRKIFGGKKTIIDTTVIERELGNEEIKQEIKEIESSIQEQGKQFNILESKLIEKNLNLSEQLSDLILQAEETEANELLEKTNEANRLASKTYIILAIFSFIAVLLLLLVEFLLFKYFREARERQQVLQNAKSEAEKFALAKEQFASNVSHEIRTPINAIHGMAEQLLQKKMGDEARQQLIILSKSAQYLKNIVNDTLDFTKAQASKLKLRSEHFSPSSVFEEVVGIERSEANAKGIELKFIEKGTKAPALIGDPVRLKQILLNLINNSIKFTETGFVALHTEIVKVEEKSCIKIKVEDTGIGISEQDQQTVFDEFVQVENDSPKKQKGTGLGLSIVKKIVELHDGRISISSELNKGTVVSVELCYPEGDPRKIKDHEVPNLVIPKEFKKLSVLVVDDEEYNRFMLKGIFNKWRIKYNEAVNGNEAIAFCSENNVDIVLMDINMPVTSGIDATKTILKEKPSNKIIAISASTKPEDIAACTQVGMIGYLTKPFSETELFDLIIDKLNIERTRDPKKLKRKKASKEAPIYFDSLMHLANNDQAFFREMLEIFIRSAKNGIDEIEKNYRSNNLDLVAETAHKLASPAKHIQAMELFTHLKALEENILHHKNPGTNSEIIELVKYEINKLIPFIEQYLEENKYGDEE